MMIEWADSFDTGIADVDQDHRRLVGLVNDLDAILSDNGDLGRVGGIIDALIEYTDYHFQREERLLEEIGYDEAAAHAETHREFGLFLGDMVGACMLQPSAAIARKLNGYLRSWLVDHILVEDMKFAAFSRGREAARQ